VTEDTEDGISIGVNLYLCVHEGIVVNSLDCIVVSSIDCSLFIGGGLKQGGDNCLNDSGITTILKARTTSVVTDESLLTSCIPLDSENLVSLDGTSCSNPLVGLEVSIELTRNKGVGKTISGNRVLVNACAASDKDCGKCYCNRE